MEHAWENVEQYRPLVAKEALRCFNHNRGQSYWSEDDLIHEGLIAAARALASYRDGKGAKPLTYVCLVVRRALTKAVRRERRRMRLSAGSEPLPDLAAKSAVIAFAGSGDRRLQAASDMLRAAVRGEIEIPPGRTPALAALTAAGVPRSRMAAALRKLRDDCIVL